MLQLTIRGTVVVAETGVGVSDLFVKAYDKDLIFDDLMGTAYTREDGRFEIISDAEDFRDLFEVKPDIYLKVFSPDAKELLHTTKDAVRFQAGRLEEFEVRIPQEALGDWIDRPTLHVVDDDGQARPDVEVGESLQLRAQGLQGNTTYDVVVMHGQDELLSVRFRTDPRGRLAAANVWPQLGLFDLTGDTPLTVEQAHERWRGQRLRIEIRRDRRALLSQDVHLADRIARPLLVGTDGDGVVRNGFEVGRGDAIVSGLAMPFHGQARVFMVARQHDWRLGDFFEPVELASGRPAFADADIGENRAFRTRVAMSNELTPGAYDFIVRELRYGYEDDEDWVLSATDVVTRRLTGLVVREEFMASKAVLGGCVNTQPISGRKISGKPYYQFTDTFQVGEDVYAALDPAALDPALIGKMYALYVVPHKDASGWSADKSLNHLAVLGGNPAVQTGLTTPGCINYNDRLLWADPQLMGEYDVVADFGNNTGNASAFDEDATFDAPLDIIDGYFLSGFRVVPDPTTDTGYAEHGSLSYNESTQGFVTVQNDYGQDVNVPLKAVVRFPADSPDETTASGISAVETDYPIVVIVHGQGHNYMGYDYLLNHWARNGFIAASIYLVNSGGVQKGSDRARVLFKHLTILKNMFGTKAQNNIGIMGHSRGGEGVTIAPRLNQHEAKGHGLNAVIALAPTNQYTNEVLGGAWATPYLVIYGAMDGDVNGAGWQPWHFALGNSGFALYDKANGADKSTVFVYGATHNRFTTIGTEGDVGSLGLSDLPKLIDVDAHQKIALGYMTAYFRWKLKNESEWEGIFKGEWVPAAVEQANGGNVQLYVQHKNTSRMEVDNFDEAHTATSWKSSTLAGSVSQSGLVVDPAEDELFDADAHSPHQTSGLLLEWNSIGDYLRYDFTNAQDVRAYNALSVRIAQKVGGSNPANQMQDLYLTLMDSANKSRSIKISKFGSVPPPQVRSDNTLTKSALTTVRIPLHVFEIEVLNTDRVNLRAVTRLQFDFKAKSMGEIDVDSVEFTD